MLIKPAPMTEFITQRKQLMVKKGANREMNEAMLTTLQKGNASKRSMLYHEVSVG